jgi:hypothetical protein
MDDPGLMVHVLLIGVDLLGKKLFNELFHLAQGSEFKSIFFSVKKNLAGEESPEDLEYKFSLTVLLSSQNLFQGE